MAEKRLSINQWAEEDRPREKMIQKGAKSLSEAELLAILIGSGSNNESAVQLMQRLMRDCNNSLNTLAKMSLSELTGEIEVTTSKGHTRRVKRYKGLGEAKAITIMAACELGIRRKTEAAEERVQVTSPEHIRDYFHPKLKDLDVEECYVLLMNQASIIIGDRLISRGGFTETTVDIRRILHEAITQKSTVIALCHNHPSGNKQPSTADERITLQLKKACEIMNIRLLDHIILADESYYSFQSEGKM